MNFETERDFEDALVRMLTERCGWKDGVLDHPDEKALLRNWADILYSNNRSIDRLGDCPLTDGEMQQIIEQIKNLRTPVRLNGFINGKVVGITRDNRDDAAHFGKEVTLDIFDPLQIAGGKTRYQIARQPRFAGRHPLAGDRRGDIMLLINGMPLIHVELKKSNVPVGEATGQIERYMGEGVYSGLFSLVQVFVGMTPEESVYFANPGPEGRFNRDYFFHWTESNNERVNNWDAIAEKLLSIPMAHQLIGYYTVADAADGILKVMRPYQFYAARVIFNKVIRNEEWEGGQRRLGGYIWHTTGSGKTLTCFKAAQLITSAHTADKVVFLLDRRELGTQSLGDYRGFAGENINDRDIEETSVVQSTENTRALVAKLKSENDLDALIVTSIQKMSRIREEEDGINAADIERMKSKRIVVIVDECHRDTDGEMLRTIKATFPEAMFFGFTGTPKFKNGCDSLTADIFGDELHRYTLADGINDRNVLGFDPYMVPTYKDRDLRKAVALDKAKAHSEEQALADSEKRKVYLKWMNSAEVPMTAIEAELPPSQYDRPEHRKAVVKDIADNFMTLSAGRKFHAIFATSSIPEAIEYYRIFKSGHSDLRVTALFDPNIDNNGGAVVKEEAMIEILNDYNVRFGVSYDMPKWNAFKKDVANRLAHKERYLGIDRREPEKQLDILIVVDQMLTGFDSKWLNTLYLDKMRDEENLIQAFSRTNRLFGPEKPFGTIKYYRKPHTMRKRTEDALKLYSGEKPLALYVERKEQNLNGMNQCFDEIVTLFRDAGVADFERLPDDGALRGQFAKLFKRFNDYLNAAKVQGFTWRESVYTFHHEDADDTMVTMSVDERVFGILAQRYRELAEAGGRAEAGGAEVCYQIEPYLTEIDIGRIDADYMNEKFNRFLRCLDQPNVSKEEFESVKADLHSTFASLSQEDQKYAQMLIDDIAGGNIELEAGLTIQDYIRRYKTNVLNRSIDKAVNAFGVDRGILEDILSSGSVTEANLNEYGRFDRLWQSADEERAKAYLETALGEPLSLPRYRSRLRTVLKEFLMSGGKGDKIPEPAADAEIDIRAEIEDAFRYNPFLPLYSLRAACGVLGQSQSEIVEPEGWIKAEGIGRLDDTMVVVRAVGDSMEPTIKDGDYCVFRRLGAVDYNNRIVLVQRNDSSSDPESGGAYLIKEFHKDGDSITLHSRNPKYPDIHVDSSDDITVVAYFHRKIQ